MANDNNCGFNFIMIGIIITMAMAGARSLSEPVLMTEIIAAAADEVH
jgi:hypothetical protein